MKHKTANEDDNDDDDDDDDDDGDALHARLEVLPRDVDRAPPFRVLLRQHVPHVLGAVFLQNTQTHTHTQ